MGKNQKKSLIMKTLLYLSIIFLSNVSPATELPKLEAFYTETPPVIDGSLSEQCWKKVKFHNQFTCLKTGKKAEEKTAFAALFDDKNLYFGIKLHESNIKKLRAKHTERDGSVHEDDCIELFFDPFGTDKCAYHWIINSRGSVSDAYINNIIFKRDLNWNSAIKVKASKGENVWFVEAAIPLSDFPEGISSDSKINICRERYTGEKPEYATFCKLASDGKFYQPEKFACLKLMKKSSPVTIPNKYFKKVNIGDYESGKIKIDITKGKMDAGNFLVRLTVENNRPTCSPPPVKYTGNPVVFKDLWVSKNGTYSIFVNMCTPENSKLLYSKFSKQELKADDKHLKTAESEPDIETRGVWYIYNRSADKKADTGIPKIKESIKLLAENNFNLICPELKQTNGQAWWPSKVIRDKAFSGNWDPLKITIEEAHKKGILVYAWFDIMPEGKQPETLRGVLKEHPELGMISRDNVKRGWLCPNQPGSWEYIKGYLTEIIDGYDVDGMILDYFRYPSGYYCYCDKCRAEFKKKYGIDMYDVNKQDPKIIRFKMESISGIFKKAVTLIRNRKPSIPVMMYLSGVSAVEVRGQNWPEWVEEGFLDIPCLRGYEKSEKKFFDISKSGTEIARNLNSTVKVFSALGVSSSFQKLSKSQEVIDRIILSRKAGMNGQVHFFYKALVPFIKDVRKSVYRKKAKPYTEFLHTNARIVHKTFLLSPTQYIKNKQKLKRPISKWEKQTVAKLRKTAEAKMQEGPWSVMDKKNVPPSGDKHDFISYSTYFWQRPDNSWEWRDGQVNPALLSPDTENFYKMCGTVEILGNAGYLLDEKKYFKRAAFLIRHWFLNPASKMNPNMNFTSGIPGKCTGRGVGIHRMKMLVKVLDVIGILPPECWTSRDQKEMEKWIREYMNWALNSKLGKDEKNAKNNHATYYASHIVLCALFIGDKSFAKEFAEKYYKEQLVFQIMPDGLMPQEIKRTKPYHYVLYNLKGMSILAELVRNMGGMDIYNYQTQDGRSLKKAFEWIIPYQKSKKKWPRKDTPIKLHEVIIPFRLASLRYKSPYFEKFIQNNFPEQWESDFYNLYWAPRRVYNK